MTPSSWQTRLTRTAALAALSVALTTVAAAPASAGPLEDLLATIGTGSSASSGSSIPGPSTPPVGGPASYDFTISTGSLSNGDYFTARVADPRCVSVAGASFGEPIGPNTRIGAFYRTEWTITRETTPECTNDSGFARIAFTNRDGRTESVYANVGRVSCASDGCRDTGRGNLQVS